MVQSLIVNFSTAHDFTVNEIISYPLLSIWNFAKGISFGKTIVHTSQQGPNLATHTQQNFGLSLQVSDRVGDYIQR